MSIMRVRQFAVAAGLLVAVATAGMASGCDESTQGDGTSRQTPSAGPTPAASATPSRSQGWAAGYREISGGEGVVLETADVGARWMMQVSGAAGELKDIWFADELHGWAVGRASTILATSDGGEHWAAQKAPGGYNELYAVTFTDALHGWVVGGANPVTPGTILVTSDGGQTWQSQRSKGAMLFAVSFIDEQTGWATGAWGLILATRDGGKHWRTQDPGAQNRGLFFWDVTFTDARHGWIVGETRDLGGLILATSDGGAHWTRQRAPARHILVTVSFADDRHGCAGGVDGLLLTTTDGGATWTRHRPRFESEDESYVIDDNLCTVFMADPMHITAVGQSGLVCETDDGGHNWTVRRSRTSAALNSVFFAQQVQDAEGEASSPP